MRITVLIENKSIENLRCEHGLAVHIACRDREYLLDTGASDAFLENGKALGIDISRIDTAVLSHGHYDHSGGYEGFFRCNQRAKVYLRQGAGNQYFKISPDRKYIGVPKGLLEKYPDRFVYVKEDCCLDEGVWLIGHHTPDLALRGKRAYMYCKTEQGMQPDDFSHEQSLVFETPKGLVILNSCSHGGIDNIVVEVKERFPGEKVAAVIGGFHLMGPQGTLSMQGKPQEVRALGERLRLLGVERIYTGHCTGEPAFALLAETLGEQISYLSTGTRIEIEE